MFRRHFQDEYEPEEWDEMTNRFADPGGNSALHRASRSNPRNKPCPTCKRKNMLTQKDVDQGYQCDNCADQAEIGY